MSMMVPDVTMGSTWRLSQARSYLTSMRIITTQTSDGTNYAIRKLVDHTTELRFVLTNDVSLSMNANWDVSNFTIGLNTAAAEIGGISDIVTQTGLQFYAAGPYSTQVYKGSSPFKLDLEFTCYNDKTLYESGYGDESGATLSTADVMVYELSRLMSPRKIMPRNEWQIIKSIKNGYGGQLATMTAAGFAGKMVKTAISQKIGGSIVGDAVSEVLGSAAELGMQALRDLADGDELLVHLLKNTGNDFLAVDINDYLTGFFVCNSMTADVSRERVNVNSGSPGMQQSTSPRSIKFKLSLTSLQIPSKYNINNSAYGGVGTEDGWKGKDDIMAYSMVNFKFGATSAVQMTPSMISKFTGEK